MTLSDKNKYTFKYFKAIESTHGPSRLVGQPVYPHFVGLANSKNNYLGKAIGAETASFLKSMGFNTLIGPDARLSFTPDWGKTYHSLGQDKDNAR
jgi:beta-glucosidase-like glycosyl hydrolase